MWLLKIVCFFKNHLEVEEDFKTIYHPDGGWYDMVTKWRCVRCDNIRDTKVSVK
jgi:hypothetical protein